MAQRQENLVRETTKCYRLYKEALENQTMTGLREKIPECVDFYEGRQWPKATESTKNLPRPVVNIVKMICRAKKGAILSTPVRVQYKSYSPFINIEKFNSFASSVFREMGQDELDRRAIDDGIKKGSYFFHYFWDADELSNESGEAGALSCELIDPLNIFFSNPNEVNEQKQDWIIISSQVVVKKLLDKITDSKLINSIILECCEGRSEVSLEKETMLLLTRYFKKDGEIYCERQTKFNTISEPFKIIPDSTAIDLAIEEMHIDNESKDLSNSKKISNYRHFPCKKYKSKQLYPIVSGYYERKESSIYGMGEVEGLIPNQKAINFNIAMNLLNAQQCAWGKYIALPNALGNQKISNVPGQVLIDFSGTGEGIKRMPEGEISSSPMSITLSLEELTRTVSGTSSVMTGDAFGSNLSGAAIAYLQSQAQVPIDELRNTFWYVKRKQGKVVAQFLRHFYFKRLFINQSNDKLTSNCQPQYDEFSSNEYKNASFEVYVEAVGGTKASLASDISLLDTCLKNGSISLETYIRAYPESAITNKEAILKQINCEKENELQKLKEENSRLKEKVRYYDAK